MTISPRTTTPWQRHVLDALGPDLFVGLLSPTGILLEANEPVLSATGLDSCTALGRRFDELECWSYCVEVQQQLREALQLAAAGIASRYDVQLRAADGQLLWIDFSLRPVRDETGAVVHLVPSAVLIDERKRAEQALQESEFRFRQLAASVEEVFFLTDVTCSEILYMSPAYETIWGRKCEDLYRSPLQWLEAIHEDDRPRMAARVAATVIDAFHEEYRVIRPDGSMRWVHVHAFPIRDDADRVYRVAGVARDITTQKLAAEEQARFEARLHQTQKLRALGTLSGGIAHDFNNILAVVHGYSGLASRELAAEHPVQDRLATIDRAARRGTDLVQQIMTFSRPEERNRRIVGQLRSVLEDALKLIRSALPPLIELHTEFDIPAPTVEMDVGQINQIVMNLCTNASHAIGNHFGQIKLALETMELTQQQASALAPELSAGPHVRLSVSDTGCGMDESTLARIFEPFFSTKQPDKGTGLGLSVVYGIVKGHRGAITVCSRPDEGTTFHIYLPATQRIPAKSPITSAATDAPRGSGEHVLYVDPDESMLMLMKELLEARGYRVSAFNDPTRALASFRERHSRYDLAVTDLATPTMTGIDFATELRRIRPGFPVVITSGFLQQEQEQAARSAGLEELLQKPSSVDELANSLHRLCMQRRQLIHTRLSKSKPTASRDG
ncbi:PAS domain-containing protein [Steroidobacter cummioxidans]|uniref:hybrid sensor histidine kinase/response regulator n=1 Tax=Steroidobacter cummioxidans TaxID=1803913 RepID=UPI000E30E547|nr:PAS domain-containing protein [Steroidobacter cummioxidans]